MAAIFTPPDAISMLSLAVPLVALYEISILCVMMIERGKASEDAARAAQRPSTPPKPPPRSRRCDALGRESQRHRGAAVAARW